MRALVTIRSAVGAAPCASATDARPAKTMVREISRNMGRVRERGTSVLTDGCKPALAERELRGSGRLSGRFAGDELEVRILGEREHHLPRTAAADEDHWNAIAGAVGANKR